MFLKNIVRSALHRAKKGSPEGGFSIANAIALGIDHYLFYRQGSISPSAHGLSPQNQQVLIEVKQKGFSAIEGFVAKSDCEHLRKILLQRINDNPELLHPATPYDLRLHGIDNVDPIFMEFARNPLLEQIATAYLKRPSRTAFTLGASLQAAEGNPGSGGGWHRDSMTPQFKTMLYLTDVSPDNGPFQIIESSHHFLQTIKDNRAASLPYGHVRMTQNQVDRVLESSSRERLHTLHYPAGTLLMFDSSTIHRGCPIKAGTRLALTNYFYPESQINSELYQHFNPVAGHVQ